jgi:sulfur-oxidizing protein SoxY
MRRSRRALLATAGWVAAAGAARVGAVPAPRPVAGRAAFETAGFAETLQALGCSGIDYSADVALRVPEVVDSGAVVPVSVTSALSDTRAIYILVDGAATALAAAFDIPAGTEPQVTTRVRLPRTGNVIVVVRCGERFFGTAREVRVLLGGF